MEVRTRAKYVGRERFTANEKEYRQLAFLPDKSLKTIEFFVDEKEYAEAEKLTVFAEYMLFCIFRKDNKLPGVYRLNLESVEPVTTK